MVNTTHQKSATCHLYSNPSTFQWLWAVLRATIHQQTRQTGRCCRMPSHKGRTHHCPLQGSSAGNCSSKRRPFCTEHQQACPKHSKSYSIKGEACNKCVGEQQAAQREEAKASESNAPHRPANPKSDESKMKWRESEILGKLQTSSPVTRYNN
jgi:hypothetical protein